MYWLLLISIWLLGMAVPVCGQPASQLRSSAELPIKTLSIDQALQIAQEQNPYWKAELAKTPIADAEIITARALPNPLMISDNGVAEDSYRLGVQQSIFLGGKIKNRVRIAQARKESLSASLKTSIMQLRREVRSSYVRLYVAQEKRRILLELLEHYEDFLHMSDDAEDHLQIEFVETTIKNDLEAANFEEQIARQTLNALLYRPIQSALALEKPRTTIRGNLSMPQLAAASEQSGPELLQNAAQAKIAGSELALARSNRVPNFTMAAGPDMVTPPEVAQISFFVIGYLDLPLLNLQKGPIREAKARQHQLGLSRQSLQNMTSVGIANGYTTYLYTLKRLGEHEGRLIPRAQEMQLKAREHHKAGKLTVDTLVEADTHRANMELSLLNLLRQNQDAISELEMASGMEL